MIEKVWWEKKRANKPLHLVINKKLLCGKIIPAQSCVEYMSYNNNDKVCGTCLKRYKRLLKIKDGIGETMECPVCGVKAYVWDDENSNKQVRCDNCGWRL